MTEKKYTTFDEFYPFYLSQHSNGVCRLLHFIGSILIIFLIIFASISGKYKLLFYIPLIGYGFAWIGHFFFEKNRPATFTYPLYSLMGDWVMFFDICRRKEKIFN
jgi:hypothetical protein